MEETTAVLEKSTGTLALLWATIADNMLNIILNGLVIVLSIIIAKIVMDRLSHYTTKMIEKARTNQDEAKGRQTITALTLLRSIGRYAVYFVVLAVILNRLGFGDIIGNILVTAGFGSLAISFGAQSIVKDVVTGFFMMFERQFSVGDFVKIGEFEGTVTSIAMRVTYLRNSKGQKIIIPNGSITNVINYTNEFNTAVVIIPTPYGADTARIMTIIEKEAQNYAKAHKKLFVEEPRVTGITNFGAYSVDVSVSAKVKAMNHWQVERELRLAIKECLEREKVEIPYQKRLVEEQSA